MGLNCSGEQEVHDKGNRSVIQKTKQLRHQMSGQSVFGDAEPWHSFEVCYFSTLYGILMFKRLNFRVLLDII